jgi:hypothetical protein
MIAYEGGQSLPSKTQDVFDTNFAIQTSPAMADQINALATMWKNSGGELFCYYQMNSVWSKFGYWSLLPLGSYINRPNDPVLLKYRTVAALAADCDCGNAPPATPPTDLGNPPSNSLPGSGTGVGSNPNGNGSGPGNTGSSGDNGFTSSPANLTPVGQPRSLK